MDIHIGEYPEKWADNLYCDTETTGLDPHRDRLLALTIFDGKDIYIYYWNVHDFTKLIPMLESEKITKTWHNATFDLAFLKSHLNIDSNRLYDTMLAENVLDGGRGNSASLANILLRRSGIMLKKDERISFINHPGFENVPPTEEQIAYMVGDVLHLPKLKQSQTMELIRSKQVDTAKLEFEVVPAIVAMEHGGINFDVALWYEQAEIYQRLIDESEEALKTVVGSEYVLEVDATKNKKPVKKKYKVSPTPEERKDGIEEINFGSFKQLLAILNNRFNLNMDSTAEDVLEEVVPSVQGEAKEFIQNLLKNRKWKKRLSWNYPRYINPVTGKIHPSYHSMGARTGRFSCSDPNMQQVTRPHEGEPNMRHLFISDGEDYVIIRADYAQQEPRILGQLSGDIALIAACNTSDVYLTFARLLYEDDTIQKHDERRQIAKMFVLAVGYGSGIDTLVSQSGLPDYKCAEIRQLIFKSFPGLRKYISDSSRQVEMYGYALTALGRRRYIDNKNKRMFTTAVNTPIQGTAADMFKLAFSNIHKRLTSLIKSGMIDANTRVWNVVHDECEVHCHIKDVETVSGIVEEEMVKAGKVLCPDVSHFAEVEYARSWDK